MKVLSSNIGGKTIISDVDLCSETCCRYLYFFVLKEPDKDIQKLLKPSSSGDLSKEAFHSPAGAEEAGGGPPGHTASLLHITEKRREYGGGEENG